VAISRGGKTQALKAEVDLSDLAGSMAAVTKGFVRTIA
jgi:hypothetical protein